MGQLDQNFLYGNVFENKAESHFSLKIGGTVYEVSTHFSADGRQSVLRQFSDLLLSRKLL